MSQEKLHKLSSYSPSGLQSHTSTNHNKMDQESKIFEYSEDDFIHTVCAKEFQESNLSTFDKVLRSKWHDAIAKGLFRYTLEDTQTKTVPGKWSFIAQLNVKRLSERRAPQVMSSVKTPFDPCKFHFNKANKEEIILELCPSREKNCKEIRGHPLFINISPLEYGHCLIVPDMQSNLPQVLTETSLRISIEMMLLSAHPGFRIGFNGLCALASVNHQHLHVWYTEYRLASEWLEVKQLCGECYETIDWPAPAFVFQLHGTTISEVVRQILAITSYFVENEIPHNVSLTRGVSFHDDTISTVRIYIIPRAKSTLETKVHTWFHVACAELIGHLPIYDVERFDNGTEEEIAQYMKDHMLPESQRLEISKTVSNLLKTK